MTADHIIKKMAHKRRKVDEENRDPLGTVILVAAADRGHFSWSISLAYQLVSLGYCCELFTHELGAQWAEETTSCFSKVDSSLGSGLDFNKFVAAYKKASSAGDSDCEGAANVCSNNNAGFQAAVKEQGFESVPLNFDVFFSQEGKGRLAERFNEKATQGSEQSFVISCVWERVWCDWVAPICHENGVPNLGLMPSHLHPYRAAAAPIPFWWFDNENRVRNLPGDIDPRVNSHKDTDVSFILATCLRPEVELPAGVSTYGPFLLPEPPSVETIISTLSQSNSERGKVRSSQENSLLSLLRWLEDDEGKPVILISLGSQSCLSTLGEGVGLTLLRGCLLTSCRVLAVGVLSQSDESAIMTMSPEEDKEGGSGGGCGGTVMTIKQALMKGQLRLEPWINQWVVLHHPAIQKSGCFLTHCGANSVHEGLASGVRMCTLPFFDDQYYIAEKLHSLYYGSYHHRNRQLTQSQAKNVATAGEVCRVNSLGADRQLIFLKKSMFRPQLPSDLARCDNEEPVAELNICSALQQTLGIPMYVVSGLQEAVLLEEGSLQAASEIIVKSRPLIYFSSSD
jgi:hypothetical protein